MPKVVMDLSEFYDLKEAAEALGIGIATLFRWKKKGSIATFPVGRRTLIPKCEVERIKKATETEP